MTSLVFEVEAAEGERWTLRLRTTGPPFGHVEGTRTSANGPDHPVTGTYVLRLIPGFDPVEFELRLDGPQWVMRCALTPRVAQLSLAGEGTCLSEDGSQQRFTVRCGIIDTVRLTVAMAHDLLRSLVR
ncbi:hypothetical protein [Actinokineospora diospyrosa]|uniref:Immunity protein 50 of polymorphic toxin system n=1 Tax=Actinokineospora diospyrosa TaxID=103728 RepID=A0ABT1IML1_9PSEU|nr:hypothetical protein [Actinokineospora diospyrosa]MCP2273910.1 hypothetical protein [Actinokineospora diospyrosa]